MNSSQKTSSLSSASSHTGTQVSIFISAELIYLEFPKQLSAQNSEQLCLALNDCDMLQFCIKKRFNQLENASIIHFQTDL